MDYNSFYSIKTDNNGQFIELGDMSLRVTTDEKVGALQILTPNGNYFVPEQELSDHGFKISEDEESIKIENLIDTNERVKSIAKGLVSKRIPVDEAKQTAAFIAGDLLGNPLEEGYYKKDENHAFTIESYPEGAFLLLKSKHSVDPNLSPFCATGSEKKVTVAIKAETGEEFAHSVINLSALMRNTFEKIISSKNSQELTTLYLKKGIEYRADDLKNANKFDIYKQCNYRLSEIITRKNYDESLVVDLIQEGRQAIRDEIEQGERKRIETQVKYLEKYGGIPVIAKGEHDSSVEKLLRDKEIDDTLITFITPLAKGTGIDFGTIHRTPEAIQENMRHLAEQLREIHNNNIVHEDIKPANILLFPEAKIADFGLSNDLDKMGGRVGTYFYLSPEKASGTSTNPKADDLFALALTFFAMLPNHNGLWITIRNDSPSIEEARGKFFNLVMPVAKQKCPQYAAIYDTVETMLMNYKTMTADDVVELLSQSH